MPQQIFEFADLEAADLVIDATYRGGKKGDAGDDPISKLLRCGNQGGFRAAGVNRKSRFALVCLYSSLADLDWPDSLDVRSGQFVYYGDNKSPGHSLHETPRSGNKLLRDCFSALHADPPLLDHIPPFFVFTKGGSGRDVVFRGLAVPGAEGMGPTEDLVAVWKSVKQQRFQNYRAVFTILDEPVIRRAWIAALHRGEPVTDHCPSVWAKWLNTRVYLPLKSEPVIEYRTKDEQLPSEHLLPLVHEVYSYFKDDPFEFERCAVELFRLMDRNIGTCDLTRRWMDGGRDAVGQYKIGPPGCGISVDFALEAKCYDMSTGVGVRDTSRLISRLRYRQFGVFVTTSYVSLHAYKEIIEDGHPILVVSSGDITRILLDAGYATPKDVRAWLSGRFPKPV
jgi:hypothetical protein